jgi:nucleoside-diphosphate-sugar epimerase
MRVAIIGCGWVGTRLSSYLKEKNHHVIVTTTSPEKISSLKNSASEVHLLDFSIPQNFDFLKGIDVAIFSMPISRNNWLEGFKNLDQIFPKTILFSSTGIYPTENQIFTENDTKNLREDILASENLVKEKHPQTTILRFGGLMGDNRSLQNIFKNKSPENPQKKANYIHYDDILAIVEQILHSDKKGKIYNLVAPEHPTISEILNLEIQKPNEQNIKKNQRIISSESLIKDFNYTFIHPNPKYF